MRWLGARGRARRTRRHRDVSRDRLQQRLAVDIVDAHIEIVGKARVDWTVQVNAVESRKRSPQTIAQCAQAQDGGLITAAQGRCGAEPDNGGDVEGARAVPTFMAASVNQSLEVDRWTSLRNIQRADPFRSVELVRAQRHEVDAEVSHVQWHESGRLRRITMEERPLRVRDLRDGRKRVEHTDFVVRRHRADEERVAVNCITQLVEFDSPLPIDLQVHNAKSVAFQCATRIENSTVLCAYRHDAPARLRRAARGPLDGEVVGFGGAAGEYNIAEP